MQPTPGIHITRREHESGSAAFVLTLSGSETLERLAAELVKRLQTYTSNIDTQQHDSGLQLAFCADKAPLGKWELGRINREALLALHAAEPDT